jgi:hypothetical protein
MTPKVPAPAGASQIGMLADDGDLHVAVEGASVDSAHRIDGAAVVAALQCHHPRRRGEPRTAEPCIQHGPDLRVVEVGLSLHESPGLDQRAFVMLATLRSQITMTPWFLGGQALYDQEPDPTRGSEPAPVELSRRLAEGRIWSAEAVPASGLRLRGDR